MYIRTKDGVYELVDTYYMCVDGVETYMYDNNGRGVEIRGSQILNQSENLEELCDEFVIEYADGSNIISIHDNTKEFLKEHKYELKSGYIKNVYGAVWVDGKGLIYVAKMDENGELELI